MGLHEGLLDHRLIFLLEGCTADTCGAHALKVDLGSEVCRATATKWAPDMCLVLGTWVLERPYAPAKTT